MIQLLEFVFLMGIAYVIGSIPFSLILAKSKRVNLREVGSGNIGATNVFRAMGWKYGLVALLLDGLKGYVSTTLALNVSENAWVHVLVGLMSIVGHSYTIFAGYKGGKGVATGLGVLLALSPDVFTMIFSFGMVLIAITRYVAPVTIFCSIATPVLLYLNGYATPYIIVKSMIAMFIVYRHRSNIRRIITGTENRL